MSTPPAAIPPSPPDSTPREAKAAEEYESRHVHAVYEEIAPHFSSTRYKPWPIVAAFLENLPDGSVGLDVGCGNGKYLGTKPSVWILGSDRSTNLTRIAATAQKQRSDAIVADGLVLPHAKSRFDFAISIAVIHHLSTPERRVQALRALLETLRPPSRSAEEDGSGGRALVFVWALEQKGSRRGWGEGDAQDVMVPWVMKEGRRSGDGRDDGAVGEGGTREPKESCRSRTGEVVRTFQRYYHLYRCGELERDIVAAGGRVLESGYERDNWWAIAVRKTEA